MTEPMPEPTHAGITEEEEARERLRHVPIVQRGMNASDVETVCSDDRLKWPCPTIRLLNENKALRESLNNAHEMLFHVRDENEALRDRLRRLRKTTRGLNRALEKRRQMHTLKRLYEYQRMTESLVNTAGKMVAAAGFEGDEFCWWRFSKEDYLEFKQSKERLKKAERLALALKSLANEAGGMLRAFELEIRDAVGNSNYSCAMERINESEAALADFLVDYEASRASGAEEQKG